MYKSLEFTKPRINHAVRLILLSLFYLNLNGQLLFPSYAPNIEPNFGVRVGEAGTWDVSRPYGSEGFTLNHWNQSLDLNPTGSSLQAIWIAGSLPYTSSKMGLDVPLTSSNDTAATWLEVHYKQGDYNIMNFGIWYHTSISPHQYYGQLHEIRKFPRYIGSDSYSVEDHRAQWIVKEDKKSMRLTAQLHKALLPFNDLNYDELGLTGILGLSVYEHQYATGGIQIHDSTQKWIRNFELWERVGSRKWLGNESHETRTIALMGFYNRSESMDFLSGGVHFKNDSTRLTYPVFDANFKMNIRHFDAFNVGFKSLYHHNVEISPDIRIEKKCNKFKLSFLTKPLLQTDIKEVTAHLQTVSSLNVFYQFDQFGSQSIQFWETNHGAMGWKARYAIQTDSRKLFTIQYDQLLKHENEIFNFADEKLTWSIYLPIRLRSGALLIFPGLMGEHYFNVNSGVFNPGKLRVEPSPFIFNRDNVHLVHANITAVIQTLSINYTNYNANYDPLLTNISALNLPQSFISLTNTPTESSFHVLTVTWAFMN